MTAPLVPHFDLPFRLLSSAGVTVPVVVEQDSLEDVVGCVSAALRTEKGSRMDLPDFGVTDPTFQVVPIDTNAIINEISAHEERAGVALSENPDTLDFLVDSIIAEVGLREEHRG